LIRTSLLAFLLAIPTVHAQQATPPVLRDQVPNRRLATSEPFAMGNLACRTVRRGGLPFLVWDAKAPLPIARDPATAAAWLLQHAADLGHGVFTPVHRRTFDWHGNAVHAFGLQHDGFAVHDAEVWVCFDAAGCCGLVNRVPLGLDAPPAPLDDAEDPCFAVRRGAATGGGDQLVFAERRHTLTATHDLVEFVDQGVVFARESTQLATGGTDALTATFTEYVFGGFPDQIAADSRGVVWCSDPTSHRLIQIDPQTGAPTYYPTAPWQQPDGLCVDDKDRVWTGFYNTGDGLGRFDRATGAVTRFAAPYANATFAIPTVTNNGKVWISDHVNWRLTPFDIATSTFGTSVVMPANSWPVGGHFDPASGDIFVPLYQGNAIARIHNGVLTQQSPTPVGGPAFVAAANGKVWISYWLSSQLGEFDVQTGTFVTHNIPLGGSGGPIDVGPNGHIYLGTRGAGYIVDFDPITNTSVSHLIPSNSRQLKDGLCVAPDGTVWFTSSSSGRVARMTLQ